MFYVVVVDGSNISQAAAALNIAKPAISRLPGFIVKEALNRKKLLQQLPENKKPG